MPDTIHSTVATRSNEISPEISVIIPVYNREDTIVFCLNSLARQTLPVEEVILVDDGSTDSSASIISSWINDQKSSTRYVYIRQENQGKSAALNTGFAATNCEWIAFNDSDDCWVPRKIEIQMDLLKRYPNAKVCFSDSRFVNDPSLTRTNFEIRGFDKQIQNSEMLPEPHRVLAKNPNGIFMQTMIAHRSCAVKAFPLDPQLRVAQDIDLLFRLALTTDFCLSHESLVEIDRTPERNVGLTKQHDMKSLYRIQTKEKILSAWLAIRDPKIKTIERNLRKNLANTQRRLAQYYDSNGNAQLARDYLKLSFRNKPTLVTWFRYVFKVA